MRLLICLLSIGSLTAATIDGTVTFDRGAPPAVLLWLPGDSGWQPAGPIIVDQKAQAFSPVIAVCQPGGTVTIRNSDTVQHNVFSLDPDVDLGLGQPASDLTLRVTWPAGSVVRHGCKIHPQMQLWVASLATAHHVVVPFAETALSATFTLEVPASTERLSFWSPRGEPMEAAVSGTTPIMRKGKAIGSISVRLQP